MRAARLAASLAVVLSTAPAWGAGKARAHPDTQGDQDCAACHAQSTPEVVKAWEASPHGLSLVKCLVCHGSTGKDFVRVAVPERCRGCHGAEVDAAARLGARGGTCFTCHEPHALRPSPHGRRAK